MTMVTPANDPELIGAFCQVHQQQIPEGSSWCPDCVSECMDYPNEDDDGRPWPQPEEYDR